MPFPERIVCLAAEMPEIFYRLGVLDRVIGISAYTKRPQQAHDIPKVSGFQFGSVERIMKLKPDLVILTSGVQKELASKLAQAGATLLHFNPHRLSELFDTISLLGNVVGKATEASHLNAEVQSEILQIQAQAQSLPIHPRVYFEEWMDPLICGTGWVSDLIEIAGGQDIFREKSIHGRNVSDRVIEMGEVVSLQPDIVLASWCGKPFDIQSFESRPSCSGLTAIQRSSVYEIDSQILQFGPMLVDSLKELFQIFKNG